MTYRFDRDYTLKLQIDTRIFTIKPDIRVTFDGSKSISGGLNSCNMEIYNLNPDKRRALVKDAEEQKLFPVELSVGYKNNLLLLFKGTVHIAGTRRSGTDYITKFECLDGGHALATSSISLTVTKRKDAIMKLLEHMNGITLGSIPELEEYQRPLVMVGNPFNLISKLINEKTETWFIADEKLYILKDGDALGTIVTLVSPETGLLDTPERKDKLVTFSTVINPAIKIGERVMLKSTTAEHLNGTYKVQTIQYKGDYTGSDWSQSCECVRS
jgi:hypothetical protein